MRKRTESKKEQQNFYRKPLEAISGVETKLQQAFSLYQEGKTQQAEKICQQVLANYPLNAEAIHILGVIAHGESKHNIAVGFIKRAIELDPKQSAFYNNLGNVLREQEILDESAQAYSKAIQLQPNSAEIYNNLGVVLQEQGKLKEAIQAYEKAIEIRPDCTGVYINFGNALQEQGEVEKSIQTYRKAIQIQPDSAEAHKNLGMSLLLTGSFDDGWKQFAWRWQCKDFISEKRHFPQSNWDGSNLRSKTILVWAEQGIGDEIMFASMLSDLLEMGDNIIVECDARLIPLFQRSFPKIQFLPRQVPPDPQLFDTNIDYQIPMGNLGQWLRFNKDSFTAGNYLLPCSKRVLQLKGKYRSLSNDKLLIGISWKSINRDIGKTKSTLLEDWTSVLSQDGCYFINLQYGDTKSEIEEYVSDKKHISIYQDKEINPLTDLDGFAAQVSALDLVISTSNTTVHLAGALGQNVWTLLRLVPSWRWMTQRTDTLWYPKMRLFRQQQLGNWSHVFDEVKQTLENYIASDWKQ